MNTVQYDPTSTMKEARGEYFRRYNLGEGGYHDAWVKMKMGPIPIAFPNTASRKLAVRIHDLHHVLTGYPADWPGEFRIAAWEVAGSCRNYTAAWVLNILGFAAGLLVWPRQVFRAFVRGRRSGNLYHLAFGEDLLQETVASLRGRLFLIDEGELGPATGGEIAAFAGWAGIALLSGGLTVALTLLPLALLLALVHYWG